MVLMAIVTLGADVLEEKGGKVMYIQQGDLFRGMDRRLIKELLHIAVKESHEQGEFLFHCGERAGRFYILMKGYVKLIIGDIGHVVHVVDHAGEAFGWSSLVGRDFYSASAECVLPTKVISVETDKCRQVLEKYPHRAIIFYRRLAKALGDRLLSSYEKLPGITQVEKSISFGSGQMVEIAIH